jgi:hypothetical protein
MTMTYRAILILAVAFIAAVSSRTASSQDAIGFKMPSDNIFCQVQGPYDDNPIPYLRCDLQQITSKPPPRPKDCPLSWGDAFTIAQNGLLGMRMCHGDTVRSDALPVLAYGSQWSQSGFMCKSATSGLTCTNAQGHGYMLSKAVQKVF